MIRVELILTDENGGEHKLTNLLGMNKDMLIHANPAGQVFFALTERIRVIGEGFDKEDPQAIFRLLERDDVNVYFMNALIFHSPDWNPDMVDRFVQEIVAD